MLDDLRKDADELDYDELGSQQMLDDSDEPDDHRFLGLSPVQRLVISLMVLVIIVLLGILWLLVNGKIVPPFM
jgi:hypothetical protein